MQHDRHYIAAKFANFASRIPDMTQASHQPTEYGVTVARDQFSDLVGRAQYGGEILWITRGRSHRRVAALVPAYLVEQLQALAAAGQLQLDAPTGE